VSSRVEQFRQRAAHCDHMASQAKDLDAKSYFAEAAEQWRELARGLKRWIEIGTARHNQTETRPNRAM
jgi:hypothetical protein